ncbi:hypothetical protein LPJ66_001335 [Kickxella alabastrina]|uniref:Uncharacterized protein n=1 Tax=Kickxella alabastrina TaxID=61397 RepID=A0ACC1ITI9_9FUNG|nr:hypothetical protein LPJ66_001335 [Kickxella alabastrina]
MDRSSMGNAKISGLEADLNLRATDYSIATSLFYPTYLLFQPLSNWCLKRFGACKWLPTLTLLWGGVITAQAFASNRTQLFLCRVLLGIPEAGYNSGAIYLISYWYPKAQVTRRVSIFYTGTAIGTLIAGPIALGLTKLNHGFLHSWHTIFFVEGIATMAWALVMFVMVPSYPDEAWVLKSAERAALVTKLSAEKQQAGRRQINTRRFVRCLFNPTMFLISLILLFCNVPLNTIMLFGPQVVRDMGFTQAEAQGMQALPGLCGFFGIVLVNWSLPLFGTHYLNIIFNAFVVTIGGVIMLCTANAGAQMFALCMFGFGSFGILGLAPGWLATNVASNVTLGSAAASVLLICGGSGGIIASNIYRNWDSPRYILGHSVNMAAGICMVVLALAVRWNMGRINRQKEDNPQDISFLSNEDIEELEERHPGFRFVY